MMKLIIFCLILVSCREGVAAVQKHALVIGIKYEDLVYAEADAMMFSNFLRDSLGFSSQRIELLLGTAADRNGILRAIQRISNNVRIDLNNGDAPLVYVYYSGHSITDENGLSYFLTSDSSLDIPSSGIRSDEFLEVIKRQIPADRIIWFLDTCYAASSQNGGHSKSIPNSAYPMIQRVWESYFPKSEGYRMGFYSSFSSEKSWEDPALGHGIFTYYLLRGLRGEADQYPTGNGDGQVTAGKLKKYLETMVPIGAARIGHSQHPSPTPVFDWDFPLAADEGAALFGIYQYNIPQSTIDRILSKISDGERVSFLSFDSSGNCAIIADKTIWGPIEVINAIEEHRRTYKDNVKVTSISLYDNGYAVIFDKNGYAWKSIPDSAAKSILASRDKGNSIRNIIIPSASAYLFLEGDNGYWGASVPQDLLDELHKLNQNGQTINHVALTSGGGWIVVHNGYNSEGRHLPKKLVEDLTSLEDRKKEILAIAFDPATNGWIMIAER